MDEIQRKLRLIDEQLARKNLHERIISTCPLVFVAAGLILGILIQSRFSLLVKLWAGLLVVLGITAIVSFSILRHSSASRYVTAYLAFGCFVCLGAIRLTHYTLPEPGDIRRFITDERKLATIRGSIITEPRVNTYPDWEFARFKPTDPTSSFYLNVTEIETNNSWEKVTGVVRVQVGEPVLDLKVGDAIQAYCWLDRFAPVTNHGQFDTAGYMAKRNIFVAVSIQSRDGITLRRRLSLSTFVRLKSRITQTATNALLGDMPQDENRQGLLQALLLGYRRDIDRHTYQAFQKTGLLHLISLSGLHLGILVGIIWWLCKTVGFMKPTRAVICAIAVGIFLLIVPPRAPTIRAAIICWVFCASILLRRHANPINTLSLAAIILLLLIRPTQLFEVGWQLSFASVLGIVLFTKRIEAFMIEHGLHRYQVNKVSTIRYVQRVTVKITVVLVRLIAVGLAAWLGSVGILLYHFHAITPLAFIWTVLVLPLVGVILILGFIKIILFFLLPTLSAILGVIVIWISGLLTQVVELIAQLDFSQILFGRVSLTPVVLYYSVILFTGFVVLRRPRIKHIISIIACTALIVYLGAIKCQRTHGGDFTLTCLDVGHGQAILAQLPDQTNIMFDAGSLHRRDVGSRIITPYLEHVGIKRIDTVVISHNDIDHINGIPEVVEHCQVKRIFANDAFLDGTDTWGTAKFLLDWMNERELEIKRFREDIDFGRAVNLQILWPDQKIEDTEALSDNDKSLVILMEYNGTNILLCSDIEAFAQKVIIKRYPELKADVVVVPHHGSATTSVPDFLEQLDAKILICSCDRNQYERFNREIDPPYQSSDISKSLYTAINGAITIRLDKEGRVQIHTYK